GDAAFFALGGLSVSPDHRLLAYTTDTEGGERFTLRFRDLESGTTLPEVIEDTYYGLAWANDSATVFYTRPDLASRPYQLWRHRVGTAPSDDRCVHTEEDERFFVRVHKTKDDAAVIVSLEAAVTTEVRVVDADDPLGEPRVLEARRQGIEYEVEHRGGQFLIVTNDGAENFRLMVAPDRRSGRAHWRQVLPYDPEVRLEGIEVFARHLVLVERAEGYRRIRVANLDAEGIPLASTLRVLDQPEAVGTAWLGANLEADTTVLRYGYTSLITPRSVYEHDMATGRTVLRKRQPILGGYDPATYRTERRWARTEDGEAVPISLVHRADVDPDGTAACLVYGYGSYEVSVDPVFSSLRLSLLDRGVVVAIAHVRGGGELGRRWYREGALATKHHTFTDFIACARHLVAEGWAAPDRLVARGASAGGLLMGVVANQAPGLFAAIIAEVPFVDCLTTLMDPSLPLTVTEWEEWGNPVADPAAYRTIKAYSPYDNVGSHPYPRILATAGLNDARVAYWEPAKWVQKLRACAPDATVLLRTELGAGHQGPSGRYDAWRDEAVITAFILDAMGLANAGAALEGSG
ncbi:MAG TPA: S9 family peptidase, partial [Acidimicrobiales bacterium]|nr:S9 family peptidase [Acidimicrobiales bacterium]